MKRLNPGLLGTPLGILITVGVVVFSVELMVMLLLHSVIIPGLPFQLPDTAWGVIDAIILVALVFPALYFLVFLKMQKDFIELTQLAMNMTDTLLIGVMLVDRDLRVRKWNQWLAHKTGMTSQQACGKLLTELFPDFHSLRLRSAIEMCIDHKSPQLISQALNHHVLPIQVPFAAYGITLMHQQVNVVPLMSGSGETLAVVSINDVTEGVAKSFALAQLVKKFGLQGNRDQLTGAYNRHFLWSWLAQQLKQCVRHSQPLSCLMVDIDHFKLINDTYGHDVGDAVLRGFCNVLNQELRESDILVRYGGEEFAVFLPHADTSAAMEIANRILHLVRGAVIEPLEAGAVRCSIGVSSWTPDNPCSAEELLKKVDRCLYQAKHGGRDQVMVDSDHLPLNQIAR